MIWASIPREAILAHCPLSDLHLLSNSGQAFLSLEEFRPGRRTLEVSARLREKNTILSTTTAQSMGAMAKIFGMDQNNVSLIHIQDIVSRIVDGWQVGEGHPRDIHTMSSIASSFAFSLGSRTHRIQDVIAAFLEGTQQGMDTIAYFARRRRRPRARL
jgi:hypothetical protein